MRENYLSCGFPDIPAKQKFYYYTIPDLKFWKNSSITYIFIMK